MRTVGLMRLQVEQRHGIAPLNIANGAGNFFLKPNGVFFDAKGAATAATKRTK